MRTLLTGHLFFLLLAGSAQAQEFLGKDANTWSRELDRPQEAARRNAAYALGKLGMSAAPVLPALLKCLEDDGDAKVREAVVLAVGEIGRDSNKAVPNPKLVPALRKALKDNNYLVRRSAALALGNLGDDAGRKALDDALSDTRPEVRQNAAWALGKLGPASVPGLRKALGDADPLVKRDAAAALQPMDPKDARLALAELLPLCGENNSELRKAALLVLIKVLGPEDTAAVPRIRPALIDPDTEVRANAALALSNIGGKEAEAAVPILRDALRRGDVGLRRQAGAGLRNIGPAAKAAVPDLIEVLRDSDEETRANAALALGGIGPDAAAAVPALVRAIVDKQEKSPTRIEAAVALSRIGPVPAAVEAVPTLLKVLQDAAQDGKVRERIVWALRVHKANLRTIPGIYPTFTKILTEPVNENNRMLRYDCAYMLGVLQGADVPKAALNVLLEFLRDDSIQIFTNKNSSVGGTGQETGNGKANVKEIGRGDGRVMAVQALGQIGPGRLGGRQDIIQQLRMLANDGTTNEDLREDCRKLLKMVK